MWYVVLVSKRMGGGVYVMYKYSRLMEKRSKGE